MSMRVCGALLYANVCDGHWINVTWILSIYQILRDCLPLICEPFASAELGSWCRRPTSPLMMCSPSSMLD